MITKFNLILLIVAIICLAMPACAALKNENNRYWQWESAIGMPELLIEQAEDLGIEIFISASIWEKIKASAEILRSGETYLGRDIRISPDSLLHIYQRLEKNHESALWLVFQDYILRLLFHNGIWTELTAEQENQLRLHGIKFMRHTLAGGYIYTSTLVQRAAVMSQEDYWGQFAYVQMLKEGDIPSVMNVNSLPYLEKIVQAAKHFLDAHSESHLKADIYFIMGQAEETYFYLIDAKDDPWHAMISAGVDTTRAQQARIFAIEYYLKALELPGGDRFRTYVEYVTPLLRSGVNAGNRYFIVVYD